MSQQVLNQPGESQPIRKLSVGRPVERAQSEGDSVINLNRSNSDCTTRKTDVSPFVRMSVERTNMRRKKVSEDSENFNNVFYLTDWSKEK